MKHHSALTSLTASFVLAVLLSGCTSGSAADQSSSASGTPSSQAPEETQAPPSEPLDLTGEWKQSNSNDESTYQVATIADGQITIDWVNDAESTRAIYWVGTYVAPTEDADSFTWESQGDVAQMETAILASQDSTKTFSYEGGVLKYELSALGVTMTVEMARQ